jgi:hypothetical protein
VESAPRASIQRWVAATSEAEEPCILVDEHGSLVVLSASAAALLDLDPEVSVGLALYSDLLPLVDFTAASAPLAASDLALIPPLLAISSRRLARGLMRLKPAGGGPTATLDAVSTPLLDGGDVVGSLTFLWVV